LNPVILFRKSFHTHEEAISRELESANQHFGVFQQRTEIPEGNLVIGRYSVLPYYRELEKDLQKTKGDWKLIEINDGQMSGLSENNPDALYSNLCTCLWT